MMDLTPHTVELTKATIYAVSFVFAAMVLLNNITDMLISAFSRDDE